MLLGALLTKQLMGPSQKSHAGSGHPTTSPLHSPTLVADMADVNADEDAYLRAVTICAGMLAIKCAAAERVARLS